MSGEGPWSNQVQSRVIVGGPAGSIVGVFLYNGTPGPGNPPVAWMSKAATDPYGNTLPAQDIVSYNAALTTYAQLSAGQVNIGKTGLTQPGSVAQSANALHPGAMLLTSPQNGANTRSQLILEDSGELNGPVIVTTTPLQADDPNAATVFTSESWHALSLLNGWAQTSSSLSHYSITNDNMIEFVGALNGGAATSVNIASLANPYRPATTQQWAIGCTAGVIAGQSAFLNLSTGGTLFVSGITVGTVGQSITLNGRVSRSAPSGR